MNVLIIRNAYKKDTGGAEKYSFNLSFALKNSGHKPILVTNQPAIQKMCRDNDITYIRGVWHDSQEWGKHYYFRKIATSCWYIYLILRYRVDVVCPQSRDDFVFATIAAKFMQKPCYWVDHADLKYIMDRINHPHPRMQKWILTQSMYVKKIFVVSKSEQKEIIKVAPEFRNKLMLVYNGVFLPNNIHPVSKPDKIIIGSNARLVPEKGIEELIMAFSEISKLHDNCELWLLGGYSGNEKKYRKIAANLNLSSEIKFIGYQMNPLDYMASMDIFVHASHHEAFSLAVIEACMLGLPVVATRTGGTPEIIIDGSTGILVKVNDAREITNAILELIANPKKAKALGSQAKKHATENFEFMNIVRQRIVPEFKKGIR